MSLLQDDFDTLRERLRGTNRTAAPGDRPLYYLVFPPEQILAVKREMTAWCASLRNVKWDVSVFSLHLFVRNIFQQAKVRELWLKQDRQAPLEWSRANQSLSNALTQGDPLTRALIQRLEQLKDNPNALLLITDVEALHPYLRFGPVEGRLYGHVHVPTIVFYPGTRSGESSLSFLGIYPDDGNYRSIHIGSEQTTRTHP
jgi:hypothetical protein